VAQLVSSIHPLTLERVFNLLACSGIVVAFWVGFLVWFLFATERSSHTSGGATQLVFKQNAKIPELSERKSKRDTESGSTTPDVITEKHQQEAQAAQGSLPKSNSVFSWYHMNYDISLSGGKTRRLLDDVSGFVAPGKMVSSILNCLCTGS
jgi:ATP-binding cassette subfamily G (WHITE) protein 2 (SNQ2)